MSDRHYVVRLDCGSFGVLEAAGAAGVGVITSGLRGSGTEPMIDAIEGLVMAHAAAGVDVAGDAYHRGLMSALEAVANHVDDYPKRSGELRVVEYYRCWTGSEGDTGTWDTSYVDVDTGLLAHDPDMAVRVACETVEWGEWGEDGAPAFVGYYAGGAEEEDGEPEKDDE